MGCACEPKPAAQPGEAELTLALTGNPNCGKTSLFNLLTGIHQRTGNWPGVTVERKEGICTLGGRQVRVVDLPGIYSLDAASLDECVARDYLLTEQADLILNILDAANLERSLYLTAQLLEMGVPLVLVLNMMDVARERGIEIDLRQLEERLGCPVIGLVATSGEGLERLDAIIKDGSYCSDCQHRPLYAEDVERALADIKPLYQALGRDASACWLAVKALEGDGFALNKLDEAERLRIHSLRHKLIEETGLNTDLLVADQQYDFAHALAKASVRRAGQLDKTRSDRIDSIVLHNIFGIPIFLLAMYLMFVFTINIGGAFIDFFDKAAEAIFVGGFGALLQGLGAPEWLRVILADGLGGGIQVVASFVPIISALYLFLSVLEDSGYMARAAFVMDRAMRALGLPGKAFVPLIVGFGCNVPAIMATRTLEDERERRLTILMNPYMSCGARLPVFVLFAAAFFPDNGQNLVFLLYLLGIGVAVLSGFVMKKTLLAGVGGDFLMEMPRYHLPTLRSILLRTWDRLKLFVREAGQIIVIMVLVLNVLNSIGTDGSFGNENSEQSLLSTAGKLVTPVFSPLGITEDNWPATVGIFSGILAKEVVVGTLDAVYGKLAADSQPEEDGAFSLAESLHAALATIPENLGKLGSDLLDPLHLTRSDTHNKAEIAEEQGVKMAVFGEMEKRFDGQAGAFAYLLFILLYFPCVAVIGAIVREAGGFWAFFVACWTTATAFVFSTIFYQLATFERHPGSTIGWVTGLLGALILGTWLLRQAANSRLPYRRHSL